MNISPLAAPARSLRCDRYAVTCAVQVQAHLRLPHREQDCRRRPNRQVEEAGLRVSAALATTTKTQNPKPKNPSIAGSCAPSWPSPPAPPTSAPTACVSAFLTALHPLCTRFAVLFFILRAGLPRAAQGQGRQLGAGRAHWYDLCPQPHCICFCSRCCCTLQPHRHFIWQKRVDYFETIALTIDFIALPFPCPTYACNRAAAGCISCASCDVRGAPIWWNTPTSAQAAHPSAAAQSSSSAAPPPPPAAAGGAVQGRPGPDAAPPPKKSKVDVQANDD
jgi:hypothetical protein